MTSFYDEKELQQLGLKRYGCNVLISKNAQIYGAENIIIGNNVRIDDFCVLSGKIVIGDYVHLAVSTLLFAGNAGIEIGDFSGISSRCAIYAISDDYSGMHMAHPTIPDKFRKVLGKKVSLGKHVIVGTNSTILPGVTIEEGAAIGAMSLINKNIEGWMIYAGIPAKKIRERSNEILELEKEFLAEYNAK